PRHAPDLLHAERPDLRARAVEGEAVDRGAREVPLRALGEDGHAGEHVGPGLEVPELLPLPAPAAVARPDTPYPAVGDEQLDRGRLGQDRGAARLGLAGEEAA